MISPFEVYLVMQLDTIRAWFFIAAIILTVAFGICTVFSGMLYSDGYKEDYEGMKKVVRRIFPWMLISIASAALTPTTKTAAAMLILPAITSEEVVEPLGNEARELYDLAKQALRKSLDAPLDTTTPVVEKDK